MAKAARYLLGYDLGSSSVKAGLLDADSGRLLASAQSPGSEMQIVSPQAGWAEQDPALWWEHLRIATALILKRAQIDPDAVAALGISYQMHGLVLIDRNLDVLRPAIIWCDSRAVASGEIAQKKLGVEYFRTRTLNSPGNFTASKLRWVKENEPNVYERSYKMLLPGDYIALKLSGMPTTTASGLSEGILWDFSEDRPADKLIEALEIDRRLIAEIVPTFGEQGLLSAAAAAELGLRAGIAIAYRAGDQPNNAFSLNVLKPGEAAATAGTSGVIYGVTAEAVTDSASRINCFAHVTHRNPQFGNEARLGILLCVNGCACLNSWLRSQLFSNLSYAEMDTLAGAAPIGAAGLRFLPYGNGAERSLGQQAPGAMLHGIDFNRHGRAEILRAAQEGVVFALQYGLDAMREIGLRITTVRAGFANMFQSALFREAFCNTTGAALEIFATDGAEGAARGAGVGVGLYQTFAEAFSALKRVEALAPSADVSAAYAEAYGAWREILRSNVAED